MTQPTAQQLDELKPLAAVITKALRETPVRLGSHDWADSLGSELVVRVAAYMGRTLGPDAPVLAEIQAERERQDTKWGKQNHNDVETRDIPLVTHHYYAGRADIWRQVNEERATASSSARCKTHCRTGSDEPHTHTAWDGVLLEEVYEALAESDPAALRAELIQVAAVATAWVAAIDRRPAP